MTSPNNSHTAVYEAQRNRVSRYISAQSVTKSVYSEFFVELSSLDQLGATFAVFFFCKHVAFNGENYQFADCKLITRGSSHQFHEFANI